MRLQNLLCLTRECSEHAATRGALRAACGDDAPEIRLTAAQALGEEGHATLDGLVADPGAPDRVVAEAVAQLGRRLPVERVIEVLRDALRRRRTATARACVVLLRQHDHALAVTWLTKVLALEAGDLAAAAAESLAAHPAAVVEAPLLAALARGREVRVAAARALGCTGSVAAVLPLKEVAERYAAECGFASAVRQAVAEIQARATGAMPGQLSLATDVEPGRLSLAEAEAGQLSLPVVEAGRVTLSEGSHVSRKLRDESRAE